MDSGCHVLRLIAAHGAAANKSKLVEGAATNKLKRYLGFLGMPPPPVSENSPPSGFWECTTLRFLRIPSLGLTKFEFLSNLRRHLPRLIAAQ